MSGRSAKMNALRSVVVVIGSLAFGYLTLQLGFKPYLENAQLEQQRQDALLLQAQHTSNDATTTDKFSDESDHKL